MIQLRFKGTNLLRFWFLAIAGSWAYAHTVLAQPQNQPQAEFDTLLVPLELARSTSCGQANDLLQSEDVALLDEQMAVFRLAYRAVLSRDDETLANLVTDNTQYLELYPFFQNLLTLARNREGVLYMYQQPFDRGLSQLRAIADSLGDFEPDVLVNIVWCRVRVDSGGAPQTGGFVYLSEVDGEWKFHTR